MSESFFFILGRGRSGTSLLNRVLHAHSHLVAAPEGFFAYNLYGRYHNRKWNERTIDQFLHDVVRENRMQTWKLNLASLRQTLLDEKDSLTYHTVCLRVYQSYARSVGKPDVTSVIDKNPHYSILVQQLTRYFPNARFVIMVREYHSNILSYKNVSFDVSNTAALAWRWRSYNNELMSCAKKNPERFFVLQYEHLVSEPKQALTKLCSFLDIPFESAMLNFYNTRDAAYSDFIKDRSWYSNVEKPLNTEHIHKWKSTMSTDDIQIADFICGQFATQFGYEYDISHPRGIGMWLRTRVGVCIGIVFTILEKLLFRFPFAIRIAVINRYRKNTGNRS